LREALGRLNTEGFIRFSPREGFYNRELNQKEVFDLYELRKAIELHGIRLAIRQAKDEDIAALQTFLEETGPEDRNRATRELVKLDETFHERLTEMSENTESWCACSAMSINEFSSSGGLPWIRQHDRGRKKNIGKSSSHLSRGTKDKQLNSLIRTSLDGLRP
jgi:DNA-binding GntR family transcriptional regulator